MMFEVITCSMTLQQTDTHKGHGVVVLCLEFGAFFINWGVSTGLEIIFGTFSSCGASGLNFSLVLTPVALVLK